MLLSARKGKTKKRGWKKKKINKEKIKKIKNHHFQAMGAVGEQQRKKKGLFCFFSLSFGVKDDERYRGQKRNWGRMRVQSYNSNNDNNSQRASLLYCICAVLATKVVGQRHSVKKSQVKGNQTGRQSVLDQSEQPLQIKKNCIVDDDEETFFFFFFSTQTEQ